MNKLHTRSWAEPFKIKVVEPLRMTTPAEREAALREAGHAISLDAKRFFQARFEPLSWRSIKSLRNERLWCARRFVHPDAVLTHATSITREARTRMNRTLHVTGWLLLAALGCRGVGRGLTAPPERPEVVARRYLELGGRNDLAGARALVVPDCQRGPLGEVDAVKMMGARMTVTRVETSVRSQNPTSAMVGYTVSGSVHAEHGTTTLFGAQVQINGVNIDHANQSGTLHLVKPQDRWLVTCHD